MDLIYTNVRRYDQGVLNAYSFDLSFGADENNFEMTVGIAEAVLVCGAILYMEGTEYGGMIDSRKTTTNSESIIYKGRTFHGILNSKVIEPASGENYMIVSGDAHEILSTLLLRLGARILFTVEEGQSGITISNYQFKRYCKAYDGICDMLAANGAKLKMEWKEDRKVHLSVVPIVDYTESMIDGDMATLTVEQHGNKVNHLVCLGRGELSEREVIHLYANTNGEIVDERTYSGLAEIMEIYDNSNTEDLRKDGISRFKELRNNDTAEISLPETSAPIYDIGDIVGATELRSGITVSTAVTQKIVRIFNGAVSTEYKTGRS